MKLHQLRYVLAVAQNDLNISTAADKLYTSQPGVSKQIILLEREIGLQIFEREGRNLTRISAAGHRVIEHARRLLVEIKGIKDLAQAVRAERDQTLTIGTTHTHARYVLPAIIRDFKVRHPRVRIHLQQGTSEQIADLFAQHKIDYALTSGSEASFGNMTVLPCQVFHRTVVVPVGHPLVSAGRLTLKKLAPYPIICYVSSSDGSSSVQHEFLRRRIDFNIAVTAPNADVIKAHVRLGLGVGVLMHVAIEEHDTDLIAIDASHLFPDQPTWMGLRRGNRTPLFMYDFIQLLAPHLNRAVVDELHQ